MTETTIFEPGGYRYLRGVFQYSGGVAAEPGFAVERARFRRALPLEEGFAAIEAYLASRGRPPTAFCACELRSPAPFTEDGFAAFNRIYVGNPGTLGRLPGRRQPGGALQRVPRNRSAFGAQL